MGQLLIDFAFLSIKDCKCNVNGSAGCSPSGTFICKEKYGGSKCQKGRLKERGNRNLRTILVWSLLCLKRLCKSAFSTVSFRKLVFRLSVLFLNQDIKICDIIKVCNSDM